MLCLLTSVLSLITISFDRFIAFVYPFKKHLNRKISYIIIGSIWTLAIILASPLMIWRRYRERQWHDYLEVWTVIIFLCNNCLKLNWIVQKWCPEEHVEITKYYWLFLMIPLIYFPLIIMIVIYLVIIRNMEVFEKTIAINQTPVRLKQSRTIIKMLFIYILTTIICWLPLQVVVYYRRFKPLTTVCLD